MNDYRIPFLGLRVSMPGEPHTAENARPGDPTSDGSRCVERPLGGPGNLAHLGPSIPLRRVPGPKERLSPEQTARRQGIAQRLFRFECFAVGNRHVPELPEIRRLIVSGEAATLEAAFRRVNLENNPVVHQFLGSMGDPNLSDEEFAERAIGFGFQLEHIGHTMDSMRSFQWAAGIYEALAQDPRFTATARDRLERLPQNPEEIDHWGDSTFDLNILLNLLPIGATIKIGALVERKVAQWLLPRVASQLGRRILGTGSRVAAESVIGPGLQMPAQGLREGSWRSISVENYEQGVKETAVTLGLFRGIGTATNVVGHGLVSAPSFRLPNTLPSQGIAALRPSVRIPFQAARYATTVEGFRQAQNHNHPESGQTPLAAQVFSAVVEAERLRLVGGVTNTASGGRMARMEQDTQRSYDQRGTAPILGAARGARIPAVRMEGLLPAARPGAWAHFLSVFTNMGARTRREIGVGVPDHINMNESLETDGNRQTLNITVADAANQDRVMEMAEQRAQQLGLQFREIPALSPVTRPMILNFRVTDPEGGKTLIGSISMGRVQGTPNSQVGSTRNIIRPDNPTEQAAVANPITRRIRIQQNPEAGDTDVIVPALEERTSSPSIPPRAVSPVIESVRPGEALQNIVRRAQGAAEEGMAWQVYADHLLESGDVRGELILLEDRLSTTPESERAPLIKRQRLLQQNLERDFRERIGPTDGPRNNLSLTWRRGHIDAVEVAVGRNASLDGLKSLLASQEAGLLRRVSVAMVSSREVNSRNAVLSLNFLGTESARELGRIPQLANVTELDLSCSNLQAPALRALLESSHLRRVTDLSLIADPIGEEGARALMETSSLPSLRRLDLRGSALSDPVKQALRTWASQRGIALEI